MRLVVRSRRVRRTGYKTVCVLFNGGCHYNMGRDYMKWCPACRRMRNQRMMKRRHP